ncbi:MAG: TRAP transporter large permease subunit [Alphaproteobacteria bacterium]
MSLELLILLAFLVATFGCLLSGYPVAFGLGGVGVLFVGGMVLLSSVGIQLETTSGWPLVDQSSWRDLSPLADDVYRRMAPSGQTLLAIPLFIFMGVLFQRSALADQLFHAIQSLTGGIKGGLGVGVVLIGGLLAASTGVVGASIVTLTAVALPALVQQGYAAKNAAGIVTASGTLGQVIPPSVILILLADQVGAQFQVAQIGLGNFAPVAVTSGDLFRASIVPGVMVMVGFAGLAFWLGRSTMQASTVSPQTFAQALNSLLPPLGLIVLVLGAIITGVTDTTSAASFGAVGALVMASRRSLLIWSSAALAALLYVWRQSGVLPTLEPLMMVFYGVALGLVVWSGIVVLRQGVLQSAVKDMLRLTAMIFAIIIGAGLFALCIKAIGGDAMLADGIRNLTALTGAEDSSQKAHLALLYLLIFIFLLGFVLEFVEIIVLVLPLALPVIFSVPPEVLDPVWAGILIALTLQTSFLTPPFGVALFYFRGAAPMHGSVRQLYMGVLPFIAVQIFVILLIWFFPALI